MYSFLGEFLGYCEIHRVHILAEETADVIYNSDGVISEVAWRCYLDDLP